MKITTSHGVEIPVVGLDFESYYEDGKNAKMTLQKLSTTMYVRSPKFRAHGVSIRFPDDEKAWWVSHCDLADVLHSIDWDNTALLCQNTAFDGLILSHHFNRVPKYYLDTLSMSRGEWGVHVPHNLSQIGERLELGTKIQGSLEKTAWVYRLPWEEEKKLIPYANRDVDLMWDIFDKMYYDLEYPEKELHIIDLTIRAFCDPRFVIDRKLCREEAIEEAASKSRLAEKAGVNPATLASNPQFASLLLSKGVTPPTKISPTTGKETFAFAKNDLEFQKLFLDERVADIMRARKAVKSTIGETRALRMIDHSYPTLPVLLHYCGAHTHRWSAGDRINLQNLPAGRKGQSDRLRRALTAPEGWVIVVVDSAQIEPRTNAWAAGEDDLLHLFRTKQDPYALLASEIFGFTIDKNTHKNERQVGKVGELQLGFQSGWKKYAHTVRSGQMGPPVDISDDIAQRTVNIWRRKRKAIVNQWYALEGALSRMLHGENFELGPWRFFGNNVLTPSGLFMRYPGLEADEGNYGFENFRYQSRNGTTSIYGGKFDENLIQNFARTVVAWQVVELSLRYHILSLTHDEAIYLAPEDEADEALAFGIECFRQVPSFCPGLPLDAEGSYGKTYTK